MNISQEEKDQFYNLVDSLKKCRRADLSDIGDGENVIEKLYVDPLENNFVLKSISKPNTSILIGRRGTGKSTIIARLQHDIRKTNDKLSLYIDVKSIFEQSKVYSYESSKYTTLFSESDLEQYLIYKNFLKEIISQIKEELKTNTLRFYLARIHSVFGPDKDAYLEELDAIFNEIEKTEYIDIEVLKEKRKNISLGEELIENVKISGQSSVKVNPLNISGAAQHSAEIANKESYKKDIEDQYTEVLLKCFSPVLILKTIKSLLEKIGIKYVFICLDDFSEIEYPAMKVFVDVIIAPLNNWSEEFFKFKITAYPGRIYLGDIDPQKIEQIRLDYYELFQARTVAAVQQEAISSIQRLLELRVAYFCRQNIEYFFDTNKHSMDAYYKLIFDVSSCVPRNIGWILWYAFQQSISKDKRITLNDLETASEKHFTDTVQPYFSKNMYMREPFEMKLEKFHLNELLQSVIKSAKKNKKEISFSDAKIFQSDKSKPPSSHFYVSKTLEDLLVPLELQFFITKYNEQKDQDSNELMSFYSLNFGLCMKEDIHYGKGSDRKYVIQRRFNYSGLIKLYINSAKQLVCNNNNCGASFDLEILPNLKLFDMLCPKCKIGYCETQNVTVQLTSAEDKDLLPEFDIQLLNSLNIESPQYPSSLAKELDCTYQKVGKRAPSLKQKNLISMEKKTMDPSIGERNYYCLTDNAKAIYFRD